MKLVHLSISSLVVCLFGLTALLAFALVALDRVRTIRTELHELTDLQQRLDSFSAATDAMLALHAGPGLWQAYRAEGRALQDRLRALDDETPGARTAAANIARTQEALRDIRQRPPAGASSAPSEDVAPPHAPLQLTPRSRAGVNQPAGLGLALGRVLNDAVRTRQATLAEQSVRITGALAVAALLFGALSVLGFALIHRRISAPMGALVGGRVPVHSERIRSLVAASPDAATPSDEQPRFIHAQREPLWVRATGEPMRDAAGTIRGAQGALQGITPNKQAAIEPHPWRDHLKTAVEMRQALINALPAQVAVLDSEGTIIDVNAQWRRFAEANAYPTADYGLGRNYLTVCEQPSAQWGEKAPQVAAALRQVLAGESPMEPVEYPCHSPREARWFHVTAAAMQVPPEQGETAGAVVMHVDITERKLAEQRLDQLAFEDGLTGLPSRNGFVRSVETTLARTGWPVGATIVLLDLEQQHDVNDARGYAVGDRLLIEIGRRLGKAAGQNGIVARIGGDEFAIFLPADAARPAPQQREDLHATFAPAFEVDAQALEASARFGYTEFGPERRPVEELVREAELALFRSRQAHARGTWTAYTSELDHESRHRIAVTQELQRALGEEEFELHFHPKVELDGGRLVACEALIRWHHPERGMQSPATFIPVAEQSQLIGPIGDWAVREACKRLREWQDEQLESARVAVNVSLVQFTVGDFAATVRAALAAHGVMPSALTLEITESVFESDSEALREQLHALHELGVRLSLDDFGTGYSSLLYLQQYPFDEIKIDQGFVRHMLDDAYSRTVVQTVMELAGALDAAVVAEGVEDAAVRDALLGMGCRIGQGFHYSMPLAAEDFRWLLSQRSPLPLAVVSEP